MIKYQATRSFVTGDDISTFRQTEQEFDTMDEAKAYVEANLPDQRGGKVITWSVFPNNPGLLPAMRYSSCALDVFDNGAWRGVNIF